MNNIPAAGATRPSYGAHQAHANTNNNKQPSKLMRRIEVGFAALKNPSNWSAARIKLAHPDKFDLVKTESGRCKCFLKARIPQDRRQSELDNHSGEDNKYFTRFRRKMGLLHPTDFVKSSIKPVLEPIFSHLFSDQFNEQQIDQLLDVLKQRDILHDPYNSVHSTLSRLNQQGLQYSKLPGYLSNKQINLIGDLYLTLVNTCDQLMRSLGADNQITPYKKGRANLASVSSTFSTTTPMRLPKNLDGCGSFLTTLTLPFSARFPHTLPRDFSRAPGLYDIPNTLQSLC